MKVNILSYSLIKFKEYWHLSLIELIEKVLFETIEKSGLKKEQVDYIFLGNCFSPLTSNLSNLQQITEQTTGIKTILFSGSENCSAIAVNHATKLISAGVCKSILVVAAEKISDFLSSEQESIAATLLPKEMQYNGFTQASIFALVAKEYMEENNISREDLAKISVFNHKNGSKNPLAQYSSEISIEHVLNSPIIADPLRILDSAAYSDGAAAILLSASDAKVSLLSSTYEFKNNFNCIKNLMPLFNQTSFTLQDIDVAEIYDNYSITEAISLEKMGFCGKGKAIEFLERNHKFINPSGGLKANGNAFSVNAIRQIIEIVCQLESNLGNRQIDNAKIGLTQSLGLTENCVINLFIKNE